jgi:hypothetical protein
MECRAVSLSSLLPCCDCDEVWVAFFYQFIKVLLYGSLLLSFWLSCSVVLLVLVLVLLLFLMRNVFEGS